MPYKDKEKKRQKAKEYYHSVKNEEQYKEKEAKRRQSEEHKKRQKDYYKKWNKSEKGKESLKKSQDKYRKTDNGRLARNKTCRKYREKYTDKFDCHKRYTYAIRIGAIKKGVCEICGSSVVHGHHDDYSKPFEVRWLCPRHHMEIHNNFKGEF